MFNIIEWRFEGFCVFRNGLISISDWVFGNVWSCSTLFIMKTSHKSDELKKKRGGVHKSGTYDTNWLYSTQRYPLSWLQYPIVAEHVHETRSAKKMSREGTTTYCIRFVEGNKKFVYFYHNPGSSLTSYILSIVYCNLGRQ